MAEFPILPMWVDKFIADTVHLNVGETGAYFLLLAASWRIGGLPVNDKVLARYARCTGKQWARIKPAVLPFWQLGEDGLLRQPKLERERLWVRSKSLKARLAAHARWLKEKERRDASAGPEHKHPYPYPYKNQNLTGSPRARKSTGQTTELIHNVVEALTDLGKKGRR